MKISTRGRYALRLMLDIALHHETAPAIPVALRDVARRQDISDKYLEQIITPLSRAGLVRSVRGAGGGYLLTRDPGAYTVGDILRPVEGDLSVVECTGSRVHCDRADTCVTLEVWTRIQAAVTSVVDSLTLADLVTWAHEKGSCV